MIRHGNVLIEALVLASRDADRTPLGRVYIPLEPGVTALYGLNGAGKSLLLEALGGVLTGRKTTRTGSLDPLLYVRAEEGAIRVSSNRAQVEMEGLAASLYEEFSPRADSLQDLALHGVFLGDLFLRIEKRLADQVEFLGDLPDAFDVPEMIQEVLAQFRFVLSPKGDADAKWSADPAVVRSASTPACEPVFELLDQGIWRIEDDHPDAPSFYDLPLALVATARHTRSPDGTGWPALYRFEA